MRTAAVSDIYNRTVSDLAGNIKQRISTDDVLLIQEIWKATKGEADTAKQSNSDNHRLCVRCGVWLFGRSNQQNGWSKTAVFTRKLETTCDCLIIFLTNPSGVCSKLVIHENKYHKVIEKTLGILHPLQHLCLHMLKQSQKHQAKAVYSSGFHTRLSTKVHSNNRRRTVSINATMK